MSLTWKEVIGLSETATKRSDYDAFKTFEQNLESLVNHFGVASMKREIIDAVDDGADLITFGLQWVAYLSKQHQTKGYDGRNEIACERCNRLYLAYIDEIGKYECENQCILNLYNMHRTLVQTATQVILHGMIYQLAKEDTERSFAILSVMKKASGWGDSFTEFYTRMPLI